MKIVKFFVQLLYFLKSHFCTSTASNWIWYLFSLIYVQTCRDQLCMLHELEYSHSVSLYSISIWHYSSSVGRCLINIQAIGPIKLSNKSSFLCSNPMNIQHWGLHTTTKLFQVLSVYIRRLELLNQSNVWNGCQCIQATIQTPYTDWLNQSSNNGLYH